LFLSYGLPRTHSATASHALRSTRCCGIFQQNKFGPKPAKQIGWVDQADFGAKFILLIGREALSSAGFAKVDLAKSCFQRT
jgi:hypothetical protein